MIKKLSIFIKNIRDIIIKSRLFKIYKIYKNSIKLFSILNILVLLYYTYFQFNFDYLAFLAIITSILDKLSNFIGTEFINQFKKIFFNFTDNLDYANEIQLPNHKVDANNALLQQDNYEEKCYSYGESVKDESYNKIKFICISVIGLSICAYISWDLYTHGVIYTTICSLYNTLTNSNGDSSPDDVSSNFDDSDSIASSNDSTSTSSNDTSATLVAHTDVLQRGIIVENLVSVNFWGAHIDIPAGSKILLSMGNDLIYKTPSNNVISYTRTPLGILFNEE